MKRAIARLEMVEVHNAWRPMACHCGRARQVTGMNVNTTSKVRMGLLHAEA